MLSSAQSAAPRSFGQRLNVSALRSTHSYSLPRNAALFSPGSFPSSPAPPVSPSASASPFAAHPHPHPHAYAPYSTRSGGRAAWSAASSSSSSSSSARSTPSGSASPTSAAFHSSALGGAPLPVGGSGSGSGAYPSAPPPPRRSHDPQSTLQAGGAADAPVRTDEERALRTTEHLLAADRGLAAEQRNRGERVSVKRGREAVNEGKMKQLKGALRGDADLELEGKVQEKVGKADQGIRL